MIEDVIFWIGVLLGALIFLFLGTIFLKIWGRRYWKSLQKKQERVLLQISPNKKSEKNPNIAEHLFSALHGVSYDFSFWEKMTERPQENISFEMVHKKGNLFFYVRMPRNLVDFVSGQLYAVYPEVEIIEIEEEEDYLISMQYCDGEILSDQEKYKKSQKKTRKVVSARVLLVNTSLWPIKRFSQFEDKLSQVLHDPLSGILLPLIHGLNEDDISGVQLSFRPFDDHLFRERAKECLQIISSGVFSWDWLKAGFERNYLSFGFLTRVKNSSKRVFYYFLRGGKSGTSDGEEKNQSVIDVEMKTVHERENDIDAAQDKISRLVFEGEITLFYSPEKKTSNAQRSQKIKEIFSPFHQFTVPYLNGFKLGKIRTETLSLFQKNPEKKIQRQESLLFQSHFFKKMYYSDISENPNTQIILNTEELATLFHMPNHTVTLPQINWVYSRKISPVSQIPQIPEKNLTILGKTNFRGKNITFGMRADDRRRHVYIVGKTGMGKSTLLENMIFSDIQEGKGVAVIDPHGDLAETVLKFVPKSRTNDVILFDPADREFPISFNILECPHPDKRDLVASGVIAVFKKMFADSWGPRLEHILRNTLLALIEAGNQSLLGILRMLADKKYRDEIVSQVKDPVVLSFWNDEFGKWQAKQITEAVSPIQNKVGQFLSSSMVRNILGQTKSSFDIRHAMDKGKIVVVNLSKGKVGEDVSALLGAMFITKFQIDVMSRADIAEDERRDFYLYVDEFQNFATSSFGTILSEARKYKLNLTVANQYLSQMEDEVREAIFGNVGTLISFQVGYDDAEKLSEQFGGADVITAEDIGTLPKYQTYSRIMIDGMPSPVFSSNSLPPPEHLGKPNQIEKIRNVSREKYAKPRKIIEQRIMKWAKS